MCCISTRSIFFARSFHLPKGNFRIVQTLFFSFDLMCWCWQTDPVERPSFQTIYRFLTVTHKVWLVLAFSWYSYTISSQLINEYSFCTSDILISEISNRRVTFKRTMQWRQVLPKILFQSFQWGGKFTVNVNRWNLQRWNVT